MKELLIATTNPAKIREYRVIFQELGLDLKLLSLQDSGIDKELEETGKTFEENAVQKAEFYHKLSGLPTLSDDAGIEIDYLNGEPGVHSRRWPGHKATDEELINLTLEKLKEVPEEKRGAQLRAVIGLVLPGLKETLTFEGKLRGVIAKTPFEGRYEGYPFRSLFKLPNGKYLGEMEISEAHRKEAIQKALPIIKKYLC